MIVIHQFLTSMSRHLTLSNLTTRVIKELVVKSALTSSLALAQQKCITTTTPACAWRKIKVQSNVKRIVEGTTGSTHANNAPVPLPKSSIPSTTVNEKVHQTVIID